jgi:hypothetical protein
MRKMLLLSAALLAFGGPAAFAQTAGSPSPAAPVPAAVPAPGQTPPEKAEPARKPMTRAMSHTDRATTADIRPGHEPGVGDSFPASGKASNITAADTRSPIAPRLPVPSTGDNATPAAFLADAQKALDSRQSGRAQEALERAETAMLQRSVPADQAMTPDEAPGVTQVRMARDALARGDVAGAKKAISAAMSAT